MVRFRHFPLLIVACISLTCLSYSSWNAGQSIPLQVEVDPRVLGTIEFAPKLYRDVLQRQTAAPPTQLVTTMEGRPQSFNSTSAIIHKFSLGDWEGHIQWDSNLCKGTALLHRKSSNSCKVTTDWTNDKAFADMYNGRFGPDAFRLRVVGPEVVPADITSPHHLGQCRYSIPFMVSRTGGYVVHLLLIHESYNAMKDLATAWYPYSLQVLLPWATDLMCKNIENADTHVEVCKGPAKEGCWIRQEADNTNYKTHPTTGGYWLPLKGKDYPLQRFEEDILGRSDYGYKYLWQPRTCKKNSCLASACILNVFKNKVITFLGDSHMRTTFYGVLSLLGVPYAPNRIWRGDREDSITSHGVTIRYVANYFLNLSRPTALAALAKRTVLIVGVGQHHASFCWPVAKHEKNVAEALTTLKGMTTLDGIVWLGIPASPLNTHIHSVQHRKDCRNNQRLLMYNDVQRKLVTEARIPFVDAFMTSHAMTHTNLDGAHYYTWVRDQWIEDIVAAIRDSL